MKPQPSSSTARILVADDEEGLRAFLAESLESEGHEVAQAADGGAAIRLAREEPFDLVITDLRMPGVDGMTVLRTLRAEQPAVPVVVLTAFGDVSTAVEAMKLGAFDYLEKPLSGPTVVRELARSAIEHQRRLTESREPIPQVPPSLTFGAASMRSIADALQRVAKTSATVLLQGESGTGKEVAARALHSMSTRASKPFIAINCAVLTESLLESELFGHEKGAFTGAHAQRRGRIELSDGGTFFLDEVGELRPMLQASLLRVLEERRFERVGGSQSIQVDVRWVAATHRDLAAMVAAGSFREDLYHRLSVFPIRLPPLRDRREDLIPLAESLLANLSSGRPTPPLDASAKARLLAEGWPGNIRQLRNVLERALILADGPVLRAEHLWIDGVSGHGKAREDADVGTGSLASLERAAIERTLAEVGGNRRAAAERLGIGLRTLYEKLKRYELK